MIPSYFVQIEKMPLTSNGKLNRKALPEPNMEFISTEYEAPRNEVEEILSRIWSEVLGVGKVGINDNFFDLGGHSLKATILMSKIHKELNKEVPLKELFKTPTIKELSRYIEITEENLYSNIEKVEEKEYYEASSAQKRMYILQQFDQDSTAYNMPAVFELEGKIDKNKIEEIFRNLTKRHEALRTYFETLEGELVQKLQENYKFKLEQRNENIKDTIKKFIRPFELEKAPLFRAELIENEEKVYLLVDMHHIISDGVSMSIIINEFAQLYNGKKLEDLKLQYKDFAVWQNNFLKSEEMKKQEEYWVNKFSDEIPVLNMPTDYNRPAVQSFEGDSVGFEVNEEITSKLRKLAKKTGTTMYMVLLSVFNILLSKYSGQEDIVIGTPIAGRPHADLQNIMGMFVNTLALRNKPEGEKKYIDFLKEVKENSLKAYENQSYQFEELIEKLDVRRDTSRNPLFDVMFNIVDTITREDVKLEDIILKPYNTGSRISKFDMTLNAMENEDKVYFSIEYCTKLFKKETIERLSNHCIKVLESIVNNGEIKLCEIDLLSETENNQILYEFNNTIVGYPKNKTIHELFEEQVEKTPDNIALVFEEKKLTYRELNEKSNSLAMELREKGVKADSIVGIMVERSLEMIIGIIGILKAGGAYLPIDSTYPKERIEYMLKDSGSKILLSQKSLVENVEFDGIVIDLYNDELYKNNSNNLAKENNSNDLAYIIYTSGTTGNPKGVLIEHRNVMNLLNYMERNYPVDCNDVYLLKTNYAFDVSVTELFGWFIGCGSLAIIGENEYKDVNAIINLIDKYKVTHINFIPSMLNAFNEIIEQDLHKIGSLKYIFSAGEELNKNLAYSLISNIGKTKLVNLYGPTEDTVYSSMYLVDKSLKYKSIPIGKPIQNTKLYILNNNKAMPVGIAGELCISGEGLARGYLNKPELTKEKFVDNPFDQGTKMYKTGDLARWLPDGNIEYLGRIDNQVKIRGFRIELGEIENIILQHEKIKEAVVVVKENKENDKYICAYAVSDNLLEELNLKSYLKEILPEYMIPSYFVQLEKMPLTPNGKLDRKALPEPNMELTLTEYEAPRNEVEEILSRIWSEVLGVERVGINDNFFDLGGHSLKATMLISKIYNNFYVEVPIIEIFKAPYIKSISEYIMSSQKTTYESIVKVEKLEYYPVSSAQKRMYILHQINKDSNSFNMPLAMVVEGDFNREKFYNAIETLIIRHEVLRTNFIEVNGEIVQKIFEFEDLNFKLQFDEIEELECDINAEINKFIMPFDLSHAPLIRVKLIKLKSYKYIIMIDIHHIVSDGISMQIIMDEFQKIYSSKQVPQLDVQYKDYALWEQKFLNSDKVKTCERYWINVFKTKIEDINLPYDYSNVGELKNQSESVTVILDEKVSINLKEISTKYNGTLYMTLLAGLNILLNRVCGVEDVIIGTPIAGRVHPSTNNMVGVFINTLPMRNYPRNDMKICDFISQVINNTQQAINNSIYPYENILKEVYKVNKFNNKPLFKVMINQLNFEQSGNQLEGLTSKIYKTEKEDPVDIKLYVNELKNNVSISLQYNKNLFTNISMKMFIDNFILILEQMCCRLNNYIDDIKLGKTENKATIIADFLEDID